MISFLAGGFFLLFLKDIPEYLVPVQVLPKIIPLLGGSITFVGYLIISKVSLKIFGVSRYVLFSVCLLISLLVYLFMSNIICSISMLIPCKWEELISFPNILFLISYHVIIALSYLYVAFSYKKRSLWLKVIPLILSLGIILGVSYSGFREYSKVISESKDKSALLQKDMSKIVFQDISFPGSTIGVKIPSSFKNNSDFFSRDLRKDKLDAPENYPYDTVFDTQTSVGFEEDIVNYQSFNNFLDFGIKTINSSKLMYSAFELINKCGEPYGLGQEKEFCKSESNLVILNNGIKYCEMLNERNQRILKQSLLTRGANIIEDRNRVYNAVGKNPNVCLTLGISAEPRNTDKEAINNLSRYILSSVEGF